jgi:hypothetical protein
VSRVLVVGAGRSGTTWAGRILGCAADTAYINEPDNVGVNPSAGPQKHTLGFGPYPVFAAGELAPQHSALWRMAFAGRLPMRLGFGRRVARLGLRLPTVVRDPLLTAFAGAVEGTRSPQRNVVVKSVMAQFALEWIVEEFHPRVVIIQRNPLNVVSSWLRGNVFIGMDLPTRPAIRESYARLVGQETPTPGASPLAQTTWCVGLLTTVLASTAARHPDWQMITHETLCANPRAEFHTLFANLGMGWTDEADRFLERGYLRTSFDRADQVPRLDDPRAVAEEVTNRWKKRLTSSQVDEISDILSQFPSRGWVEAPQALPTK